MKRFFKHIVYPKPNRIYGILLHVGGGKLFLTLIEFLYKKETENIAVSFYYFKQNIKEYYVGFI